MRKNRPKKKKKKPQMAFFSFFLKKNKKKPQMAFFSFFFKKKSTKSLPVQKLVVPLHSEINNGFPFLLTPWLSW